VVASCTGFVLPGIDVMLIPRLGLRADVVRMPFTVFGCGGGAAGLARACDWARGNREQAALVVAVETPSLTFRPDDTSMDNLMSALVFGDGAAAVVVTSGEQGLTVGRTRSAVVPDTGDALDYELADDGLQVVLSRRPSVSSLQVSSSLSVHWMRPVAICWPAFGSLQSTWMNCWMISSVMRTRRPVFGNGANNSPGLAPGARSLRTPSQERANVRAAAGPSSPGGFWLPYLNLLSSSFAKR